MALVLGGSLAIAVAAQGSGPVSVAARATETGTVSPVSYYRDARTALSPLIVHVRDLPTALRTIAQSEARASQALAATAGSWVADLSTARDLLTRLRPPSGVSGEQASQLYLSAALLHREAAQSLALAAGTSLAAKRQALASAGLRYYELGDRAFDSAYRLLNTNHALSQSELIFPPSVPSLSSRIHHEPGPPKPIAAWWKAHQGEVGLVLNGAKTLSGDLDQVAPATAARLAAELDAAQSAMGSALPDSSSSQEYVVGLRLGTLVLAEAAQAAGTQEGKDESRRLRLVAGQLWDGAISALAASSRVAGASHQMPSSGYSTRLLFTGGAFDGHPPALRPGDPPGSGVPGGLPPLDPMMLIGGN